MRASDFIILLALVVFAPGVLLCVLSVAAWSAVVIVAATLGAFGAVVKAIGE